MTVLKYVGFPLLVFAVGIVYWLVSYDWAGSVMLMIFGVALGVMSWVLVPTFDDVGPTAPVDPDWHEREG